MGKESISISNIRQDEWVNPFGATAEELVVSALEESGLLTQKTIINGKSGLHIFQKYCQKKNLFQEATRLGNILIKDALITPEQLAKALLLQGETSKPLGEVLVDQSICTQAEIESALARQQSIREDFYRMEKAREERRNFWGRLVRFFFDSKELV